MIDNLFTWLVQDLGEVDPLLWSPQTWGITVLLFKNNRADIAERRMEPDPVIEALHKLKDRLSGLCTRMARKRVQRIRP